MYSRWMKALSVVVGIRTGCTRRGRLLGSAFSAVRRLKFGSSVQPEGLLEWKIGERKFSIKGTEAAKDAWIPLAGYLRDFERSINCTLAY